VGQWWTRDPAMQLRVKAHTFAPVLEEAVRVAYTPQQTIYDELSEVENNNSIPALSNIENTSSDNAEPNHIISVLKKFDWESIFVEYMRDLKDYAPYLQRDMLKFLHFKMLTNKKIEEIRTKFKTEEKPNRLSTIGLHVEKAVEAGLPKNHWIVNAFTRYWDGSYFDLMRSSLVSLLGIDIDISNKVKDISDALQHADGRYIHTTRSMLVDLNIKTRLFDRYGLEALDAFLNNPPNHNWVDSVNKRLIAEGTKASDRYLLCDALFWMMHSGCMRNAIPTENAKEAVLAIFTAWQPFGVKTLLDYPES